MTKEANYLNKSFTKEDIWMANKDMKSSIIDQRSNGNIMMISQFTSTWMTRNDRQYQNAGKDVDKLEFSYIVGEKANYYNHLVEVVSYNTNHALTNFTMYTWLKKWRPIYI